MKRKRIHKIALFSLILSLFLISAFSVASFAAVPEETYRGGAIVSTEKNIIEGETENQEKSDIGQNENKEQTAPEDGNVLSGIIDAVREYSGEILSALSLIASLILAYCYRAGLTPVLKGALSNFASLLSGVRDSAAKNEITCQELGTVLNERLSSAEEVIKKLEENIDAVTFAIKKKEEAEGDRASLIYILNSQIDMMYNIFMTSALPQYQKDMVGDKIAEMRRTLNVQKEQ